MNKSQGVLLDKAMLDVIRESRKIIAEKNCSEVEFNWDPEETCECGKSVKYCKYPRCESGE